MKKVNKIAGILILVIVLLMATINVSKAVDYGATMNLTGSKTTAKINDTVTFTLSLKSVTNVEGVATVHAKINYDKSVLQFVSCEATNSWSAPVYNSENQEFVTERSDVMKPVGDIIKVTFKVISVPSSKTTTVSITDFDVADTENQIVALDVSANLQIGEEINNDSNKDDNKDDSNKDNNNKNDDNLNNDQNQGDNNNSKDENKTDNDEKKDETNNNINVIEDEGKNTENQEDNTTQNGTIPQTGIYTIIPIAIVIIIVISVSFFIKYKNMKDIK